MSELNGTARNANVRPKSDQYGPDQSNSMALNWLFSHCFAHRIGGYTAVNHFLYSTLCKKGTKMLKVLLNDEAGVILSAELVLISTILVLGMVVGLVELQCAVVGELSDLGDAFGNFDQSYSTSGILSEKVANAPVCQPGGTKARTKGAAYVDAGDTCDCNSVIVVCDDDGEKTY